jgi:hypothetical protein
VNFQEVTRLYRLQRLSRLQCGQRTFETGEVEFCRGHDLNMAKGTDTVNRQRPADRRRLDQARIRQESNGLAGVDLRDRLAEFDQPVGVHQRRQQARALARKFDRL